jgi:tripartite ATP-independent transporter DctP family solute receptor
VASRNSGLSRRRFVQTVGAGAGAAALWRSGIAPAIAQGKGKEARIAYVMGQGGAADRAAAEFGKALAEATGGELTVKTFPAGQLGGERDMVESVQLGAIEIGYFGSYLIDNITPEWGLVLDLPYLLKSQEDFRKIVDGPLATPIYEALLQRKGIRHVAWCNRGPRHLTSSKPITTPAELKGVKIRVPEVEIFVAAWKALGATVTPMALPEVFLALKQGVLDAQENPLELIYTLSFFEAQKYVNLTAHVRSGYHIVVSDRWFQGLAKSLQSTVMEKLLAMAAAEDRYQAADEAGLEKILKEKGMIFQPVEVDKFRDGLKDLPKQFATRWKPEFFEQVKAL